MKNIIDFILESQGQRHRYRATNKPYDAKNDELVHNKKTREYKKDLHRLTNFFKEFNDNLADRYKDSVHAFVFPHNSDRNIRSFSTDEYINTNYELIKKQMVQFSGTNTALSKDTIEYYDVLKNPDWMSLCSFKKQVKTPGYSYDGDDIYGYILNIANKTLEMGNGNSSDIFITKDGIQCFAYHDNKRTGLDPIFTIETGKSIDKDEDWNPDKMVEAACARVYKRNGARNCIIDLEDLGYGKLTGKNFAEAFNHVIDNW
jgi:hypothetical protein